MRLFGIGCINANDLCWKKRGRNSYEKRARCSFCSICTYFEGETVKLSLCKQGCLIYEDRVETLYAWSDSLVFGVQCFERQDLNEETYTVSAFSGW